MSEYSGIRGTRVKYLASDPTLNTSTEGQVWYNSTSGTLKSLVQIKAFSAGGNYPTGVYGQVGGAGTQTAGLAFGGRRDGVPTNDYDLTNEYNGFNWTSAPDLGTGRYGINGCGTQTAAIGAGGYRFPTPPTGLQTTVEEYDGSTWTAGTALPTGISSAAMNGLQTAALLSGGNSTRTEVLSYDGSTWTSEPALNAGRRSLRGAGTTTDAIVFGGVNPGAPIVYANTESFNGTSWTEVNNMNTPIYDMNAMGSSSSHVASNSGYNGTANTNITEEWDGTNWTTAPTSSVTHRGGAGFGTATAGVSAIGGSPPYTATEEYNSNINAITQAVWASGGNLATSRNRIGGAGTQTAGLAFGGAVSPGAGEPTVSTATEEYNGSSWTSGGALGTARYGVKGCGIQTAGLAVGGVINPNAAPGAARDTEEYNGSSWTASSDTNNNFYLDGVAGTQTAAVSRSGAGGPPGPAGNYTEEYNGATWTTVPATIGTARYTGSFIGTQTAAIYCGGEPSTPVGFLSDTYDGTSFSSAPSMVLQFARGGGAGTQTDAIVFAPSTASVNAQQYDGTSWAISANMATERNSVADSPAATASAALAAGGSPGVKNNTEEFTGGTEVVTASTLTTS